jgi:hypothetical protein
MSCRSIDDRPRAAPSLLASPAAMPDNTYFIDATDHDDDRPGRARIASRGTVRVRCG